VDAVNDPLTNMITDGQKNTPAPWVPFTRAGCNVGGVGTELGGELCAADAAGRGLSRQFTSATQHQRDLDRCARSDRPQHPGVCDDGLHRPQLPSHRVGRCPRRLPVADVRGTRGCDGSSASSTSLV